MKDYYKILGLTPSADDAEIKRAYRRMSKRYHPDVNGGDKHCEEKFKEIQEAYEYVSDPYYREAFAAYKAGGSSANQTDQSYAHTYQTNYKPPPVYHKPKPRFDFLPFVLIFMMFIRLIARNWDEERRKADPVMLKHTLENHVPATTHFASQAFDSLGRPVPDTVQLGTQQFITYPKETGN